MTTRQNRAPEAIIPFTYREITGHAFTRDATHLQTHGDAEEEYD